MKMGNREFSVPGCYYYYYFNQSKRLHGFYLLDLRFMRAKVTASSHLVKTKNRVLREHQAPLVF